MTPFQDLISTYDRQHLIKDISGFDEQLSAGIELGKSFSTALNNLDTSRFSNVVISGMGGSAIGGELVSNYLADRIAQPIVVNRGYGIPGFAGEQTLFIASSYSGNTEETLSACGLALDRKCRVITISTGGALNAAPGNFLNKIKLPPGLMPRAALGFSFTAILFSIMNLLDDPLRREIDANLKETIQLIRSKKAECHPDNTGNAAQEIAHALQGKIPVFYTATGFSAVGRRIRNQFNENAKCLAFSNSIPEMNHNEILGWANPVDLIQKMVAVFLRTPGETDRIAKRFEVTRNIVGKTVPTLEIKAEGTNPLSQMFSLIYLGDWVSYYLALLNRTDPSPIDSIDYLKQALS